ncbi:hypothetical protein CMO89_04335 [Candidatus Woesearchaeota archaeon]|nr:hypothetical protein [Candidatus Woesearchaeota archaeon]|tara:strand:+ start:10568 stop:11212 length:645 start_codon:yes stop_codon:yes gene_type:complete
MIKIDIHVHTKYSRDSLLELKTISKLCSRKGIIPVISDHNSLKGALQYRKLFKDCIVGEEINTSQGEITALFLNNEIPSGLDIDATIDRIREQDAVLYVPHPFDSLRRETIKTSALSRIKPDIIEVFNSRTVLSASNKMAKEFAIKNKYLKGVGSDAHTGREIGNAFAAVEDFNLDSKKDFLRNLKDAKFYCRKSGLAVHAVTFFEKRLKLVRK